jgi:hypothetical protein
VLNSVYGVFKISMNSVCAVAGDAWTGGRAALSLRVEESTILVYRYIDHEEFPSGNKNITQGLP